MIWGMSGRVCCGCGPKHHVLGKETEEQLLATNSVMGPPPSFFFLHETRAGHLASLLAFPTSYLPSQSKNLLIGHSQLLILFRAICFFAIFTNTKWGSIQQSHVRYLLTYNMPTIHHTYSRFCFVSLPRTPFAKAYRSCGEMAFEVSNLPV